MTKKYSHLFFDLDHTLWDYDANANATLFELFEDYNLKIFGIESPKHFVETFMSVNEVLWSDYNIGKVDKFYLRTERFKLVFTAAGANMEEVSDDLLKKINRDFLRQCPQKSLLLDGVEETLEYLRPHYTMNIITNGFEEIQSIKLKSAGIEGYFNKIITSEKAGFKKPFPGIFYYAMKHCVAQKEQSIMIGDNLQTDIKGARDYSMDQVYFNPMKTAHNENVTFEIHQMRDLKNLL